MHEPLPRLSVRKYNLVYQDAQLHSALHGANIHDVCGVCGVLLNSVDLIAKHRLSEDKRTIAILDGVMVRVHSSLARLSALVHRGYTLSDLEADGEED